MKSLFLTFFALLFAFPVMADLATAGEVDLRIELLNGEEFEGYTFFVEYQTYYYEYGYQEGPIREVELELSLIHISEPTRPLYISYAVFCLKK